MAKKRKIRTEKAEAAEPYSGHDDDIPEKYKDVTWGVWLRKTYLRYWYVVGCVFIDLIVALEVARISPESLSITLPIFVLIALVLVEVLLYAYIWKDFTFGWRK